MYLKNDELKICETLKELGFPQKFKPGAQLGRGFADLGYEQFLILPSEKLLSLFTGDTSDLPKEQLDFLFLIPTVEDFVDHLDSKGWQVVAESSSVSHDWQINLVNDNGLQKSATGKLWQQLLNLTIEVLK